MKSIEIRDFSVMVLHHDPKNAKEFLGTVFIIAHRMLWINYPYKIQYEPTLTTMLVDPQIEPSLDDPYKTALIAVNAKGEFTIDAESRAITDGDMYACIVEIGKQISTFLKENKEKYNVPVFSPHPELSHELFEEVRNFLSKGYDGR